MAPFDNFRRNQALRRQAMADLNAFAATASHPRRARSVFQRIATLLGPVGGLLREFIPDTGGVYSPEQVNAIAEAMRLLRPDLFPSPSMQRRPQSPAPAPTPEVFIRRDRRIPFGWSGNPDDPIYRGEMMSVSSSNVHSIGYQYNDASPSKGTLLVRYRQKRADGSSGPGPPYEYYGVHPAVFDTFRRAASKGRFVWDRLRVRGTLSGHRYQYKLVGFVNGYVPRQAVRYGNNEYFVQRQVTAINSRTGEKRTFQSSRPDRLASRVQSVQVLPGGRRIPVVQR